MIKSVFYQIISPAESKSLERVSFQNHSFTLIKSLERVSFQRKTVSFNKISTIESKPTKTVSLNLGLHTRHQTIKLPCQESASTLGIVQADNRVSPVSSSSFSSHNLGLCTRQIKPYFHVSKIPNT